MRSLVLLAVSVLLYGAIISAGNSEHKCRPGYFSHDGYEPCCECCAGWYSEIEGSTVCFPCLWPYQYSSPGSTSLSSCSQGTGYVPSCSLDQSPFGSTCPATTPSSNPTHHQRRTVPRRKSCPKGYKNCPVWGSAGKMGFLKAYECVDILNDLESCGGCVTEDTVPGMRAQDGGRDCSAIPNVDTVGCVSGRCIIDNCRPGFNVSADGEDCLPAGSHGISLQLLDYME